jgi:hypothetical protein
MKEMKTSRLTKLFQWLGLAPTDDERKVLDALNKNGLKSMRVVGRGTLIMDAEEARNTEKFKRMISKINDLEL